MASGGAGGGQRVKDATVLELERSYAGDLGSEVGSVARTLVLCLQWIHEAGRGGCSSGDELGRGALYHERFRGGDASVVAGPVEYTLESDTTGLCDGKMPEKLLAVTVRRDALGLGSVEAGRTLSDGLCSALGADPLALCIRDASKQRSGVVKGILVIEQIRFAAVMLGRAGSSGSRDGTELVALTVGAGGAKGNEVVYADVEVAGVAGSKVGDRVLEQVGLCVAEEHGHGDLRSVGTYAVARA